MIPVRFGANLALAAVFSGMLMIAPAVVADVLGDARQLIDQKQFGTAYELLSPLADERAGEPDFDYLLGIAALDSGRATQAIFALERVLALQPDNAGARAELARAHLRLEEFEQARYEFEQVREAELPASVARTIDDYLAAIDDAAGQLGTSYAIYVQAGLGFDENVNSATTAGEVAVPALGGVLFTLDSSGREADSTIWDISAGFSLSTPIQQRDDWRFFGGMDFDHRLAINESDFTQRTIGGNAGIHHIRGRHQFRIAAQVQRFWVDSDPNRDLFGTTAQWQFDLTEQTQLTLFGQAALLRFPGQEVRDANRFTGGIGFAHAFQGTGQPVIFLSAYGGIEDEKENTRQDIGRDLFGVRIGGQYAFTQRLIGYVSAMYEDSEYGANDPLFLRTREDEFIDVNAGLRFALDRHWSINPEVRFTNNDSTLVINDYDRINLMVYVRNDF